MLQTSRDQHVQQAREARVMARATIRNKKRAHVQKILEVIEIDTRREQQHKKILSGNK